MGRHSKVSALRSRRRLTAVTVGAVGLGSVLLGPAAQAATGPAAGAQPAGDATTLVEGTPCTTTAKACVDLATRQAWLITDGKVDGGPVAMMPGAPDQPTPVGTFHVQWKDPHHVNTLDQPMPWSVFFADGGVAFHEGSLTRYSAGCVHLSDADAQHYYQTLQVGDEVQVH
ncbi:L,D-transpeptidase [Pseudonocardia sp. N23]|uniref:L,D-transpeptidase n=1 Tax=Pseudonocardia sp. N23 TaxID=1987376 RepID=UPI000BFB12E6|nr:L,D-transpeptidase [Pseudonocardia sp. N23]GAY09918.1 putative secreted protein [Pseudonocardia sp. N23]